MKPAYAARGLELTPARLRMARTPAGSQLIINTVSAAPGFMIANVIVMAGVPAIMRAMLEAATQHLRLGRVVNALSIVVARPEADLSELFAAHQAAYPDVTMGSYPAFVDGGYRTELVLRCRTMDRLEQSAAELRRKLSDVGFI
jgi:molybdopterin-biosynthesis enzyme MoeA-like protein